MAEPTIWKLQRCLSPLDGPLLAYDESRVLHEIAMDPATQRRWFGPKFKLYARAKLDAKGQLEIIECMKPADWPDW